MAYRIESAEAAKTLEWLDERIYEFNGFVTGRADGRLFAYTVLDGDEPVGGIAGWTWAGACEISFLWIAEAHRGHRLGEQLLETAERDAAETGCSVVLLRSYSFQAPQFYQKHGYTIEHVTGDFPPGHQYYTLIKRLNLP